LHFFNLVLAVKTHDAIMQRRYGAKEHLCSVGAVQDDLPPALPEVPDFHDFVISPRLLLPALVTVEATG